MHEGQRGDVSAVAKAGELFQDVLGAGRQPLQLADHEIDDIVREAPGSDAVELPSPVAPRSRRMPGGAPRAAL